MRPTLLICAIALLAGCNQQAPRGEPNGPIQTYESADDETGTASESVRSGKIGELPPSGPLRFVGNWATDARRCQSDAWKFTATSLITPAGSNCRFDRVSEVPGGYDIEATCTAEGPPQVDRLKIRFAESAKAMLFESETIADSGLVFCGRDA